MSELAKVLAGATLVKAHVKGHYRNGEWVSDYERGGAPAPKHYAPPPVPHKVVGSQFGGKSVASQQAQYGKQGGFWGGASTPAAPAPKPKAWHPELDEKGRKVGIYNPHKGTGPESWAHGDHVAIVTPGGALPDQLNGIPFAAWADHPTSEAAWEDVDGQADVDEPDFHCPSHLEAAAGVVIEEPDGRVWICAPTNGFGGSPYVCPKGRTEGMPLQATAIKEAFEEMGLQAEITGFLGDFARTQTYTRFYRARRVGGTPAAMGWESQGALLVPREKLDDFLTGKANAGVLAAIQDASPLD